MAIFKLALASVPPRQSILQHITARGFHPGSAQVRLPPLVAEIELAPPSFPISNDRFAGNCCTILRSTGMHLGRPRAPIQALILSACGRQVDFVVPVQA
jgi:hypothetical protein